MEQIAEFTIKVYATSDRKKLKEGSKTYKYGTISIRDPQLTSYIGKKLLIKVFTLNEEGK